jgi:uncharacterized membrane protein (UPF0127 family)
MIRRILKISIPVVIGALFVVLFLRFNQKKQEPMIQDIQGSYIEINQHRITISIADTPKTQEQGLSDTLSLKPQTGKLFIFDHPSMYGFWMKDMHYALDFVWMDSSLKVVHTDSDVAPETYPQIFYPPEEVKYVLEINAGENKKFGISDGQVAILKK